VPNQASAPGESGAKKRRRIDGDETEDALRFEASESNPRASGQIASDSIPATTVLAVLQDVHDLLEEQQARIIQIQKDIGELSHKCGKAE
jgi:hypothetical protein